MWAPQAASATPGQGNNNRGVWCSKKPTCESIKRCSDIPLPTASFLSKHPLPALLHASDLNTTMRCRWSFPIAYNLKSFRGASIRKLGRCSQFLSVLVWILQIGQSYTYTVKQIYQFSNSSFTDIENIAARSNGQLLLNLITEPSTYYIDPTNSNATAQHLYTFPNATSLTGIAEYAPDVFAVVVGNYTIAKYAGFPGSFAIWSLDVRSPGAPVATKIAAIPEAHALNGMTAVKGSPGLLLIADSALGLVWSLNATSGIYQKAIQDPLLGPSGSFPLGINGLHVYKNTLYFTNSAQGFFGKVGITSAGSATGNLTMIAKPSTGNTYDDFALDRQGNAWITNHPNAVTEVTVGGGQISVAGGGNSTLFGQPTSAAFGRGSHVEECTLYVVGAGTNSNTTTISGQIIAVNVCL